MNNNSISLVLQIQVLEQSGVFKADGIGSRSGAATITTAVGQMVCIHPLYN